jgi:hypothetical protein
MKLGDGLTLVEIQDESGVVRSSWSMDVFGTYRKVQAARDRAAKDENADPYGYLETFKELIRTAGGPALNDTQADELWDSIVLDLAQKKTKRETALVSMRTLPNSMASTPASGMPTD